LLGSLSSDRFDFYEDLAVLDEKPTNILTKLGFMRETQSQKLN
jgi:hypothetical protein